MKVMTVFGTRPEAIKLAPVIKKLEKYHGVKCRICVTAQHRQMLDQVLNLFEIKPHYDLDIMGENQSIFDITIRGLQMLEEVLRKEKPDIVLVQGDTTTTFVASLAAYYLKIRVGHVEAGLRTGDKLNPFPEEINRKLTDALSDLYFVPTSRAKENLRGEGIEEEKIFVTGNTVIDALLWVRNQQSSVNNQKKLNRFFLEKYSFLGGNQRLILVTGHRRESFGREFENICKGLKMIAEQNDNVEIVYPVHLNPHVQQPVNRILGKVERIHLIEPLDYAPFVWLMNKSYLMLSDSGGIQEEASFLGKPILVMRKKTERPEAIDAGVAKMVGTDSQSIFREAQNLLDNRNEYERMAKKVSIYGDGKAGEKIIEILIEKLRFK
jgi:UDP-N-acetylglucosamine 2-epimerase (non-hydrolysing)